MTASKEEVKIIANEVAEHYFGLMKEYVSKEVELHSAKCSAGKFSKLLGVLIAVISGSMVAVVNWMLKRGNP